MADWRPWNPSNQPGTCLWCGEKLRFLQVLPANATMHSKTERAAKAGGYQDDSFCGLRCGYQFGLAFAKLGKRLESRKS